MSEFSAPQLPLKPAPPRELLHWRFAGILLAAAVVAGVLQGWVWSLLAPGLAMKVYTDGTFAPLPNESWHSFAGVAIFLLLGVLVGVWQAVAVWARRSLRGTLSLVTLGVTAVISSLTAWLVGPVFATGTDPSSVGAQPAESLVTTAPNLDGTLVIIVLQPLIAMAVYTFVSAWQAGRDLGTGLPQPLPTRR